MQRTSFIVIVWYYKWVMLSLILMLSMPLIALGVALNIIN